MIVTLKLYLEFVKKEKQDKQNLDLTGFVTVEMGIPYLTKLYSDQHVEVNLQLWTPLFLKGLRTGILLCAIFFSSFAVF